ncbi:MAG: DUF4339 domain-containing protein [Planctomycetaceae bacterium]
MSQAWFIRRGGVEEGPHSSSALKLFARDGALSPTDELRREDRSDWVKAGTVRGLFGPALPPPAPSATTSKHSSPEALPSSSSGAIPPPLPIGSDARAAKADKAAALTDLYRDSFESRFVGDAAVLRNEALTQKKREGVVTYAGLDAGESILLAVDSTIFGVATEGITVTDRAVAWFFPDGNRGRVKFDSIAAPSVHLDDRPGVPQRLCFAAGSVKHQVPCKWLKQPAAATLAELVAAAARISQGLRPDEALPRARALVEAGDSDSAIALWQAVLDDDVLQFPAILADVTRLCAERSDERKLAGFHEQLAAKANNRETGWLLPRVGDRPEQITSADLEKRWRAGTLRRESRLRHLSDGSWTTAGQVPTLQAQRTVYVADTGAFDEEQFLACVAAAAATGISFDELLVFGPTAAKIEDAAGKPILHVGLTENDLVLAWMPAGGTAVVERSPAISIVWKLSETNGARQVEIATAKRAATFTLSSGAGTTHMLRVSGDLFLHAAERSLTQERRTEAARLLDRVAVTDAIRPKVDQLRERSRADEEVLCVYEGGHPDHVDACLGTLRLDGDGFEFMSIAPESQVFFRVPYERVVDFPSPQRGALPADIQKSLLGPNSLLSAGLGVAAACVIPGGALLVRSLSGSMGGDRSAGPPINRLTAVTSLTGTAYKIYFDVVGETVAEMSQKAKTFWSRTARMKARFFKPGSTAAQLRSSESGDPETKALLREIRDSLQMVLKVLTLDVAAARRREPGVLAAAQLEALRRSLGHQLAGRLGLPAAVVSSPRPPEAIIIACPKCGARIRASRPGVIKCPACATFARLGPNLFVSRSAASALAGGNGAT